MVVKFRSCHRSLLNIHVKVNDKDRLARLSSSIRSFFPIGGNARNRRVPEGSRIFLGSARMFPGLRIEQDCAHTKDIAISAVRLPFPPCPCFSAREGGKKNLIWCQNLWTFAFRMFHLVNIQWKILESWYMFMFKSWHVHVELCCSVCLLRWRTLNQNARALNEQAPRSTQLWVWFQVKVWRFV